MRVCPSIRPSIGPSVTLFFQMRKNAPFRLPRPPGIEYGEGEVLGSDEGGKEGVDEKGGNKGGRDNEGDASDGRVSGLVLDDPISIE